MKARALLVLGLLLVASGLERFAYMGTLTSLPFDLERQGGSLHDATGIYSSLQIAMLVGVLFSGLMAALLGARATAAVGVLLALVGHVLLACGGMILVGASLAAFGSGLFRPCPLVAAAEVSVGDEDQPPNPQRFLSVAAFAAATSVVFMLASLVSSPIAGMLMNVGGGVVLHGMHVGVMLLAASLAGVAATSRFGGQPLVAGPPPAQGPYRTAKDQPTWPTVSPRLTLRGLAILAAPGLVYALAITTMAPPMGLVSARSAIMWLRALNPLTMMIASIVGLSLFLVHVAQKKTTPLTLFYGLGLVVVGVALLPIAMAGESSLALFGLGSSVAGFGEGLATSAPVAYVAFAVRGRLATLAVAGWMALCLVMNALGSAAAYSPLRTPVLWVAAIVILGGGAATLRYARAIHVRYFDPPLEAKRPGD